MGKKKHTNKISGSGVEKFYVVNMSNGKTSTDLETIPDIASWIEDNMEFGMSRVTITLQKRKGISYLISEVESEEAQLKQRLEFLGARKVYLLQTDTSEKPPEDEEKSRTPPM
jgi:hypothetical protein